MIPAPLPQGGLRGWLGGLSARDRRIYGVLVGLLLLIIAAYIVSAFFLFSDGPPQAAATTTTSPTQQATATLTVAAPTPAG
ncbi:MAG TPA: hypothetical protein VD886_12230, partial [Herpetosiphonaceae bacterium]|nr:hypothetical protein [Herpetosiphonaceae bacterium]